MNGTGVWCVVIVALGCTGEGGFGFVQWVVNDHSATLCIFAPEFGDEGEVTYTVDVGLYFQDDVVDGEGGGM